MSDTTPWTEKTARDVMLTDVVTCSYAAPLSEVERLLVENRISGMPVVDEAGHVVGVVSVKDLIERYAEDPDARPRRGHGYYHLSLEDMDDEDFEAFTLPDEGEETAESLMTADIFAVAADASLQQVAAAMTDNGVHRLLVQDGDKFVGIITTLEVLGAVAAG
jgi:CBS domain-containing protein